MITGWNLTRSPVTLFADNETDVVSVEFDASALQAFSPEQSNDIKLDSQVQLMLDGLVW